MRRRVAGRVRSQSAGDESKLPLGWLFVGLSLILLAVLPPGTPGSDGASMLEVADSLATGPTFEVGCDVGMEGRDGACFSNYYPLLSLLGAPLVWVGQLLAGPLSVPAEYAGHIAAFVVPALATAGAATLSADMSVRMGAGRRGAVATAFAVAFGTSMLTYSRTFFAETLVAFCAVLAVWALTARPERKWLGLLGITLAILAKPQVVLFAPALGLALAIHRRSVRPLVETSLAAVAGALLLFAYNWHRFESFTDFGGEARMVSLSDFLPPGSLEAIAVLTVSPGRGLLWFSPVAVLGLWALWKRRAEALPLACLLSCVGLAVIYVANPGAGFNWADRYLVALLPLMCAPLGTLRGNAAKLAVVLAAIGLVAQAPNVVGFYQRYHQEQADVGVQPADHHWSFETTQLIGVWPAAVRQLESAAEKDVRELVRAEYTTGGRAEDQVLLNVVAIWWWGLPAAGIPWVVGLVLSLAMTGLGAWLLWTTGFRGRGSPRRRPITRAPVGRSLRSTYSR